MDGNRITVVDAKLKDIKDLNEEEFKIQLVEWAKRMEILSSESFAKEGFSQNTQLNLILKEMLKEQIGYENTDYSVS